MSANFVLSGKGTERAVSQMAVDLRCDSKPGPGRRHNIKGVWRKRSNGEGPFYGWWRSVAPSGGKVRLLVGQQCEFVADVTKYNGRDIRRRSICLEEANDLGHY
jgi:hypothetical protein